MSEWNTIRAVKDIKHYDDKTERETDKPASLEEKFEYLLDVLEMGMEAQLADLEEDFAEFKKSWGNHRHGVGNGLYSSKAER